MSVSFSNLPVHRLQIGRSRLRDKLCLGLACAVTLALALLLAKGQVAVALVLAIAAIGALRGLLRDTCVGCAVSWQRDGWQLHTTAGPQPVQVEAFNSNFPWVVYIAFRAWSGELHRVWIFADSVSAQAFRCLRTQLTLSCR